VSRLWPKGLLPLSLGSAILAASWKLKQEMTPQPEHQGVGQVRIHPGIHDPLQVRLEDEETAKLGPVGQLQHCFGTFHWGSGFPLRAEEWRPVPSVSDPQNSDIVGAARENTAIGHSSSQIGIQPIDRISRCSHAGESREISASVLTPV
jgi:hypothetical protein